MDINMTNLLKTAALGALTNNSNEVKEHAAGISIAGTIVGTLGSMQSTKTYLEKYAEYNNYVTSNFGAAQAAADRYMSLKERIPMSIEYYATPTKKKEILLYINPNKISVNATKLKNKIYTRAGIYFHHYGDDTWQMNISGETGFSMMRGITKLEEAYYHSGALLKYKNISVNTIHTNNMLDAETTENKNKSTAELLNQLTDMGGSMAGIASFVGGITDAMGMTDSETTDGKTTYKDGSGENLITKALDHLSGLAQTAVQNQPDIMNTTIKKMGTTSVGTFLGAAINYSTNNLNKSCQALSTSNIAKAMVASAAIGVNGGTGSNCTSVGKNFMQNMGNGVNNILNLMAGNYDDVDTSETIPSGSTTGNFYKLNNICADDLGAIMNSASDYTNNHTIDKDTVANQINDLSSDLTDPYRPRLILIYFDDRVYIGHFDSFNWDRSAENLSIQYSMVFTVIRQVNVGRQKNKESTTDTLKNLAIGWGLTELTKEKTTNTTTTSVPIMTAETIRPGYNNFLQSHK